MTTAVHNTNKMDVNTFITMNVLLMKTWTYENLQE